MQFQKMPEFAPVNQLSGRSMLTREGWALEDIRTFNSRLDTLKELQEAAERNTGLMRDMFVRMAKRAEESLVRYQTRCTNSGMLRTECDTCAHR